jgi:hypothetical protein
MDPAKRQAIEACGTCGQPEDAHQFRAGTDQAELAVFAALGGPCTKFVASDAAVITQKYLAITDNREPRRQPGTGRIGKRLPLHSACGHRHQPGSCPYRPGATTADPERARRGAAKAREALGLTRENDAEAS